MPPHQDPEQQNVSIYDTSTSTSYTFAANAARQLDFSMGRPLEMETADCSIPGGTGVTDLYDGLVTAGSA